MKSILFPFIYETDFKAGYAWSLELATRLKCQLSIFTTIPDDTRQHYSELYNSLIKARQYHVRNLGMPALGKKNLSITRHFLKGKFESTFLKFIESSDFDMFVLPARLVSESVLEKLIHSRKQIIYLPSAVSESYSIQPAATRELFFLEMLHSAVCYNLPSSFYRSFSDDQSLFNSIAAFFKRQEFSPSNLTTG